MERDRLLDLSVSWHDEVALVTLAGDADMSNAHHLSRELELLARRGVRNVVVDGTSLGFVDSKGIRALLEGRDALLSAGTALMVVAGRRLRRVLEITGLADAFVLHESVESATEATKQPR